MTDPKRETEATLKRLADLYQSGLSLAKVALATGMKPNGAYKLLRESGVEIRPRHRRKPVSERMLAIEPEEMARLYRLGTSIGGLAGIAGVCSSTVARTLRQMGVEIRPRPDAPVPKLPAEVIAERYRAGESAGTLAEDAGARVSDIREILVAMGEKLRAPLGSVYGHWDHPWFTPERIVKLYEEGESVKALAQAAGVSRGVIQTQLLKQGVKLRGRGNGPSPEPEDLVRNPGEIRRRYQAGEGIDAIAKAMEITTWRVRMVLLKLGVILRGRAGMRGDDVDPPPMNAGEVAALYRSGMSAERIAAHSGIGKSKVDRMLRGQNVAIRSPTEAVRQPEVLRTLTDAQVARRYRKGETLDHLARAAGTTVAVIRRVLRDRQVKLRPKEADLRHTAEEIVRLYEKGTSIKDLAAMEGCSEHPIRNVLLGQGVSIRKSTELAEKRSANPLLPPEEMEARYRAGGSLSQIAADAGIQFQRVAVILRRRGVILRGRGATRKSDTEGLEISPEAMKSLYRDGRTLTEIAALAGSNRKRVSDILKSHGTRIRKRQEYGAGELPDH